MSEVSERLSDDDLRAEVGALQWYHTIELRPGIETPGWFDLREMARLVPLPDSLGGKRCLDIGTFDGFWAFEMERRGAAEVVAVDILDPERWDWPANADPSAIAAIGRRKAQGAGFEIAARELGSAVERRELSVYDLDPAEVGEFDHIYLGSLLLHLRDPVAALASARSVCRGSLIVCDAIEATLTLLHRRRPVADLDGDGRPWWWKPNLAALERMVRSAGLELIDRPRRLRMPPGPGLRRPRLHAGLLRSHTARAEAMLAWRGDPHAIIHARPAG